MKLPRLLFTEAPPHTISLSLEHRGPRVRLRRYIWRLRVMGPAMWLTARLRDAQTSRQGSWTESRPRAIRNRKESQVLEIKCPHQQQ
jgi:hypothetical protein